MPPPNRRVRAERENQKALKTHCFQGFLVVRARGLEPPRLEPDGNDTSVTSQSDRTDASAYSIT